MSPHNPAWIDAFVTLFSRCKITAEETVLIVSEMESRSDLISLTLAGLHLMGHSPVHIQMPTPAAAGAGLFVDPHAKLTLASNPLVVEACKSADVVIDLTHAGLINATEIQDVLASGTRVQHICSEHPSMLASLRPTDTLSASVASLSKQLQNTQNMAMSSVAGTDLSVNMIGAQIEAAHGWASQPGDIASWPSGRVGVAPATETVNGQIVFQPGDLNITFKRYFESEVHCAIEDDHIVEIGGTGTDAALLYQHLSGFEDRSAYGLAFVGVGLNRGATTDGMHLPGEKQTQGAALRSLPGAALISIGPNANAGRTSGHLLEFALLSCNLDFDETPIAADGRLLT